MGPYAVGGSLEGTLAVMGMGMGRSVARFVAARTSKGERGWADDPRKRRSPVQRQSQQQFSSL